MDNTNKKEAFDFRDVFSILVRRKWLIIIPLIIVTAISFGFSFLLPKVYESSTMVAIDESINLSREVQNIIPGQEVGGYYEAQRRRERLTSIRNEIVSTRYLSRLITELELYKNDEIIAQAQKMHISVPDMKINYLIYRILTNNLREDIRISFNGQNIVEITAEARSAVQAKEIAAKIADIFKDEQLKRDLTSVRSALDFTDEQLAIYKKDLDDAEQNKAEFATDYLQNQLDESIASDANIRAIGADIDNLRVRIDNNIAEQTQVRTSLASYTKSQLNIRMGNKYDSLKQAIFAETDRLAKFMSKYSWSDPNVVNTNLAINRKMRDIEPVIASIVDREFPNVSKRDKGLLNEFYVLKAHEMVFRQKITDFQVSHAVLRSRIALQPEYEIRMTNLENEVEAARKIYETFRNQLTGSEISQSFMRDGAESKYRVIEPATIPLSPVRPKPFKLALMGMLLGLVIGGGTILLAELFDRSFKKIEEVEEALGVQVLATIPNIPALKGNVKTGQK